MLLSQHLGPFRGDTPFPSSVLCLQVPMGLQGQALLKVWGLGQHAEEGPLFHNQTSVTVDSRGASVFIQTDKPVYRPQHRGGQLTRAGWRGGYRLELLHTSLLSSSAHKCLHCHPRPEAYQRGGEIGF